MNIIVPIAKQCEASGCSNVVVNPKGRFCCSGHARKGKKNTVEHNKRIGKGNKGKPRAQELRDRLSKALKGNIPYNKGKKLSASVGRNISRVKRKLYRSAAGEVTKQKISDANIGKILDDKTVRKISIGMTTDGKGSNWDKSVHHFLLPFEYRRIQQQVRLRDSGRCIRCHASSGLHTHHVVPSRIGYASKLCDHESNLVTTCNSCHNIIESAHGKEGTIDKWKSFLPEAYIYLSKFGYKRMLLRRYYRPGKKVRRLVK